MNDRRGHRKLRLHSNKHWQPKPKRLPVSIPLRDVSVLKVSLPLSFQVSLPLCSFVDAPVRSLDILHSRLKQCNGIPSGIVTQCVQMLS